MTIYFSAARLLDDIDFTESILLVSSTLVILSKKLPLLSSTELV